MKADLQGSLSLLADRVSAASAAINANAHLYENIQSTLKAFKEQQETVFKGQPQEFNRLGLSLREALNETQSRGESIAQLVELYKTLMHNKEMTAKKIDTMVNMLTSKSRWKGAPQLWRGLKNLFLI